MSNYAIVNIPWNTTLCVPAEMVPDLLNKAVLLSNSSAVWTVSEDVMSLTAFSEDKVIAAKVATRMG